MFFSSQLAENSGFNISRRKDRVKLKPKAPCACGSGKKQKKPQSAMNRAFSVAAQNRLKKMDKNGDGVISQEV